jgi:RNA polymerase subunit RPABC4/transcription elongation factor Spt4
MHPQITAVVALDLFGGLTGPLLFVVGLYSLILWMALAYWALQDARARSENPSLHLFGLFVNLLLPVLGLFIYLLVRPGTTLADRQAMALEAEVLAGPAAEETAFRPCPACGREVERDWVACPFCHTHFAKRCPSCRHAVRLGWTLCPYCATALDGGGVARVVGRG